MTTGKGPLPEGEHDVTGQILHRERGLEMTTTSTVTVANGVVIIAFRDKYNTILGSFTSNPVFWDGPKYVDGKGSVNWIPSQ